MPPFKISHLSSSEFVGMVTDDSDCKIELKTFHSEIINEQEALKKEQENYIDIAAIRNTIVQRNYVQLKKDIIRSEMEPC